MNSANLLSFHAHWAGLAIMRYRFGDCVLALGSRELMRGSSAIVLPPQVFDLLAYLIRNRERVVSKDELIATIWDGRIVSDAALTTRVYAARSAIGDSGSQQLYIRPWPAEAYGSWVAFRKLATRRAMDRQLHAQAIACHSR